MGTMSPLRSLLVTALVVLGVRVPVRDVAPEGAHVGVVGLDLARSLERGRYRLGRSPRGRRACARGGTVAAVLAQRGEPGAQR